jgi:hypothetical protein
VATLAENARKCRCRASIATLMDAVGAAHDYVHLMDSSEAEERVDRLLARLDEGIALLDQHGESHWAQWMGSVRAEAQIHDAHGLRGLLQTYGRMGSFNDVVLTHLNGHQIDTKQERIVNECLDALRSSMHSDATALLHDLDA